MIEGGGANDNMETKSSKKTDKHVSPAKEVLATEKENEICSSRDKEGR